MQETRQTRFFLPHLQRNLIAGVLALIPLWVTWVVVAFLVSQFSRIGRPAVQGLATAIGRASPTAAELLVHPLFGTFVAVLLALLGLYALGRATTHVLGRRILATFESLVHRIPLVTAIYGAVKTLVATFQAKPEGVQRVVLLDFPSRDMKAIGLVTRTVIDRETGRELAMVYVPTTPNPTSGYLEIVPVERLTPTDWTLEEAMRFIVTGGATAPEGMVYGRDWATKPGP